MTATFVKTVVAVEAVIHGFPVLTSLTEASCCWVSIQAAGLGCSVVSFSPLWKRIVKFSPSVSPWEYTHCSLTEERCPCCKDVKTGLQKGTLGDSWGCWQQVNAGPVWREISGKWTGTSWPNVGTQDVVNIGEMRLTQMVGRNKRRWFKSKYS